jgi:hypothetical protein
MSIIIALPTLEQVLKVNSSFLTGMTRSNFTENALRKNQNVEIKDLSNQLIT